MGYYAAMFLVSFATLAFEITLSRMYSVIAWYHLAFFAISIAMLGMTAGALTVYLKPDWFRKNVLNQSLMKLSLGFSLSVPVALIFLCLIPLPFTLSRSVINLFALVLVALSSSLPFYFSGMVVTALLTKTNLPIGKIYAADLSGAALGCLFVLAGLELLDAPSLIIICGGIGALAALHFARQTGSRRNILTGTAVMVILIISGLINSMTMSGIRPLVIKGSIVKLDEYLLEKWNSFSRVAVFQGSAHEPQYWGPSPLAPREDIFQYRMNIDGAAGTELRPFSSMEDIAHLKYDITNVAYFLRSEGKACVIGVGAGRDVQSAIYFGFRDILGIEINPIFIDLLRNRFRKFAGIADYPGVDLVVDEARSYLTKSQDQFSLIQMSMIDTWASTAAGAFTLSENALYTINAWEIFLKRLSGDGIFTVSRWYNPNNLGEAGRAVSLAVATLMKMGVDSPRSHIAMVTTDRISTLLISKTPMTGSDIATLRRISEDLEYDPVILPGEAVKSGILEEIISVRSLEELSEVIRDEPYNYEPPTDNSPYFFNMLRFKYLNTVYYREPGVIRGNLIATLTLLKLIQVLFFLSVVIIIVPLTLHFFRSKQKIQSKPIIWSGAVYFSLIGAGFMLTEIAMIQKLSVFLGHPVYALGILLFTVIASTGLGSYISERIPFEKSRSILLLPLGMALVILLFNHLLSGIIARFIVDAIPLKILISIFIVMPMGILMGFFFPTGMRVVRQIQAEDTPWYWALNGAFSVLCSAVAIFISIYFGISVNFYIAAACYALLVFCLLDLMRKRKPA